LDAWVVKRKWDLCLNHDDILSAREEYNATVFTLLNFYFFQAEEILLMITKEKIHKR